ncbi:hypothetical protein EVJ33_05345 [Exiguobacterium sp. SL-10]|uniref:hypothetical protein n=1 Tax=unclassified Exiguobacterium TaxID=2644629 RepID=UPI001040A4B3|nr:MULTISPECIES: hypothetical protein [unclassified Exiguobacterium]TCI22869.1 hypothetical protein EVJ34_00160 [Exiguobacterium sp. SL-9]TCI30720.1 hypothetical protein EVJ33_05345 [Exiguobacterium sp. SL-10]
MDMQRLVHNRRFIDQTLFYLALQLWKWVMLLPVLFYLDVEMSSAPFTQYVMVSLLLYVAFRVMQYVIASRASLMELLEFGYAILSLVLVLSLLLEVSASPSAIALMIGVFLVHPSLALHHYRDFTERKWLNKQFQLFSPMLRKGEIPVHVLVLTEDEIIITAESGKEFTYRHIYWGGFYIENVS